MVAEISKFITWSILGNIREANIFFSLSLLATAEKCNLVWVRGFFVVHILYVFMTKVCLNLNWSRMWWPARIDWISPCLSLNLTCLWTWPGWHRGICLQFRDPCWLTEQYGEEMEVEPARLILPSCVVVWIRSHSIDHGNNQVSSILAKLSPLQGNYRH